MSASFSKIDAFYELVADEILPELQKLDAASTGVRHWLVIEDANGTAITEVDEEVEPSRVLKSHAEQGVNVAYVTYTPGPPSEHVLAYVFMAGPVNSDVRRSYLLRNVETLSLSQWEYTV